MLFQALMIKTWVFCLFLLYIEGICDPDHVSSFTGIWAISTCTPSHCRQKMCAVQVHVTLDKWVFTLTRGMKYHCWIHHFYTEIVLHLITSGTKETNAAVKIRKNKKNADHLVLNLNSRKQIFFKDLTVSKYVSNAALQTNQETNTVSELSTVWCLKHWIVFTFRSRYKINDMISVLRYFLLEIAFLSTISMTIENNYVHRSAESLASEFSRVNILVTWNWSEIPDFFW